MTSTRLIGWILPPMVALVTVGVFMPSLSGEFLNWDDGVGLVSNEAYRGLGSAQLRWMFTYTRLGHYMPLTWLTFGINYVVGGMDPRGYHLVNILLHGASTALLFLIARRVFYLLALHAYLVADASNPATAGRRKAISLTAFIAAVLSHPLAMSLPLTLFLLEVYPLGRPGHSWRSRLREKIPYVLVALIGSGLAVLARQQGVLWTPAASRDLETRIVGFGQSLWLYPVTFVWPIGLSPLYELPRHAELSNLRSLLPLLGSFVILLVLVRYRRPFPGGLGAWLHMAVVVAPVSGLVHSGIQLGADRYAYLADLGFVLLVGFGLTWALILCGEGRIRRSLGGAITGTALFAVVVLGVGTWTYGTLWRDSESLWRWAVEVDGECAVCNLDLSEAMVSAGETRPGGGRGAGFRGRGPCSQGPGAPARSHRRLLQPGHRARGSAAL